jgi:hypothetical protein
LQGLRDSRIGLPMVSVTRQSKCPVSRAGSSGRCNTIWYKAAFKGGVYDPRETGVNQAQPQIYPNSCAADSLNFITGSTKREQASRALSGNSAQTCKKLVYRRLQSAGVAPPDEIDRAIVPSAVLSSGIARDSIQNFRQSIMACWSQPLCPILCPLSIKKHHTWSQWKSEAGRP